jgi:hypothetical protein
MLDKWSQGRKSAELVRDEIIDFSVGFYKENPEQEIKLEHIVILTRILRDNYAKAGREDIASLFDLAAEKFPQVRWMYILSEVKKQVNSAIPETESSSNLKSGNDKANPSLKMISEKQLDETIATGKVRSRTSPDASYIEDPPHHYKLEIKHLYKSTIILILISWAIILIPFFLLS